jgi:hypothetical protein
MKRSLGLLRSSSFALLSVACSGTVTLGNAADAAVGGTHNEGGFTASANGGYSVGLGGAVANGGSVAAGSSVGGAAGGTHSGTSSTGGAQTGGFGTGGSSSVMTNGGMVGSGGSATGLGGAGSTSMQCLTVNGVMGWGTPGQPLVCASECTGCTVSCILIGTKSEGWSVNCDNAGTRVANGCGTGTNGMPWYANCASL